MFFFFIFFTTTLAYDWESDVDTLVAESTRKHKTLYQCWFNVGPSSTTLDQR